MQTPPSMTDSRFTVLNPKLYCVLRHYEHIREKGIQRKKTWPAKWLTTKLSFLSFGTEKFFSALFAFEILLMKLVVDELGMKLSSSRRAKIPVPRRFIALKSEDKNENGDVPFAITCNYW